MFSKFKRKKEPNRVDELIERYNKLSIVCDELIEKLKDPLVEINLNTVDIKVIPKNRRGILSYTIRITRKDE